MYLCEYHSMPTCQSVSLNSILYTQHGTLTTTLFSLKNPTVALCCLQNWTKPLSIVYKSLHPLSCTFCSGDTQLGALLLTYDLVSPALLLITLFSVCLFYPSFRTLLNARKPPQTQRLGLVFPLHALLRQQLYKQLCYIESITPY